MRRIDHALIERLLEDETLSFREISRLAGCSDFSVRAIARELAGDPRPMQSRGHDGEESDDSLGLAGLGILAAIIAAFIGAVWLGSRNIRAP